MVIAAASFRSQSARLRWKRCTRESKPHCETCDAELNERTGIIFEHVRPDGLGGELTLENCKVHCKTCADVKTHTEDNPRMRKADSVIKKRFGLRPDAREAPGPDLRESATAAERLNARR